MYHHTLFVYGVVLLTVDNLTIEALLEAKEKMAVNRQHIDAIWAHSSLKGSLIKHHGLLKVNPKSHHGGWLVGIPIHFFLDYSEVELFIINYTKLNSREPYIILLEGTIV